MKKRLDETDGIAPVSAFTVKCRRILRENLAREAERERESGRRKLAKARREKGRTWPWERR